MAKKLSLNVLYKPEYRVIGVFCPVKDYRFCWMVNESLGYSFNHFGIFPTVFQGETNPHYFNVFENYNELLNLRLFIVNNRNSTRIIFQTPPLLDYLLIIDANESRHNLNKILSDIRSVNSVNAAYFLDNQLGKQSDQVFYDFELFVAETDNASRIKQVKFNEAI
ncbi:MAG: IPExxxVDY family protein [Bacteroidetes bacterium]|nr:IPExxxVDY family protein [Bacteroidota bacterium]